MKYSKYKLVVIVVMILALNSLLKAENFEFSGDVSGVSTYVWRGVKQFDGLAMQGTVAGSYKMLSFGIWYSSVNFGAGSPMLETDPFIEFSLPTTIIETSLGTTVYSYDFSEFNAGADYEYEIYLKAGFKTLGIRGYYLPSQGSTDGEINNSAYWLEASAGHSILDIDWGVVFGYGTYSSRFLKIPKKEAVSNLGFSASRMISKNLAVTWNYSLAVDKDLDNNLWLGINMVL